MANEALHKSNQERVQRDLVERIAHVGELVADPAGSRKARTSLHIPEQRATFRVLLPIWQVLVEVFQRCFELPWVEELPDDDVTVLMPMIDV